MFRTSFVFAALAAATAIAAPGHADSLDAFAAKHFNASVSAADRQTERGAAGTVKMSRAAEAGPSLSERAAAHFNRSISAADQQTAIAPSMSPDPALDTFAAEHFNRSVSIADRQAY
jgi:hypothetical protein